MKKLRKYLNKFINHHKLLALYMVSFLLCCIPCFFLHVPVLTDSFGTLALSFYIKGADWLSFLMAEGFYYKCGMTLVYLPFVLLIDDKYLLFQVLLVVNAALVSFIPVIFYKVSVEFLILKNEKLLFRICLLMGMYPSVFLNSKRTWAEPMLMLLTCIIPFLILKLMCLDSKKKSVYIWNITIPLLSVYAYSVHTRGIVLILAALILAIILRMIWKNSNIKLSFYIPSLLAGLALDNYINQWVFSHVYGGVDALAGNSVDFLTLEFVKELLSRQGLDTIISTFLGWLFAIFSGTYGIVCFGFIEIIIAIRLFIKYKKKKRLEVVLALYAFLSFVGAFCIGGIFFFEDINKFYTGELVRRCDRLVYTRYLESVSIIPCYLGVLYVAFRNKYSRFTGMGVLGISGGLYYFYLFKIYPLMNYVITWSSCFSLLGVFCDMGQTVRGGAYGELGDIAEKIGLFAGIAFGVVFLTILCKKRVDIVLGIYTVAFLFTNISSSYNIHYRMDKYAVDYIDICSELTDRLKNAKQKYKVIFLDDEIFRDPYQYVYEDYYIVTKRDENYTNINNMIMVSKKDEYNTLLYENDYYEVENQSDHADYHVYIKGKELNQIVRQNNIITERITLPDIE